MPGSAFFHYLLLLLYRYRARHLAIMLISSLIVSLLASVLFISESIRHTSMQTLETQPDFIVQRIRGGERVDTPVEWFEPIRRISGVTDMTPRVYGNYYFTPEGEHFLIIGIDFFDAQSSKLLEGLIERTDLKALLSKDQMIVGEGVKRFLYAHYYNDYYTFKTPGGERIEVGIFDTFNHENAMVSNQMAIMPIALARTILGMDEEHVSDIAFNVPNEAEWDNIVTKLYLLHYDIRVITKTQVAQSFQQLYNYKGGFFLSLYLVTLFTFMLILYQRYSMVHSADKKEIGIMRAVGWSIGDIIMLKFFETLIVVLFAYLGGIIAAYGYVFALDAPLLASLFLGSGNLPNETGFAPVVDISLLASALFFFAVPFLSAVLIPVWRIAVTDPKEAMR